MINKITIYPSDSTATMLHKYRKMLQFEYSGRKLEIAQLEIAAHAYLTFIYENDGKKIIVELAKLAEDAHNGGEINDKLAQEYADFFVDYDDQNVLVFDLEEVIYMAILPAFTAQVTPIFSPLLNDKPPYKLVELADKFMDDNQRNPAPQDYVQYRNPAHNEVLYYYCPSTDPK